MIENVKTLKMPVQESFGDFGKCSICNLSDIDTLNYGEIHGRKELAVHLFCLYFSTHLPQRGKENAGILGFEFRDIRQLVKSCTRTRCCYCNKGSATIYCKYPNCDRVFHQVCGFKANARFEYLNDFLSFCHLHNKIEDEDIEYPEINGCWICYEELGEYNPITTVPTCCGNWLHQQCLRKYAINAGYAFMCPLCRSKDYGDFARRHGIYVPEYEALWEKTHDYADIERYYTHCDAEECVCPEGRKFSNTKWTIQLCSSCGSYGLHELCRSKNERKDKITCDTCLKILQTLQNTKDTRNQILSTNVTEVSNNNIASSSRPALPNINVQEKSSNDIVLTNDVEIIDLTHDDDEVNDLEQNIKSDDREERLEEKYKREKAERPARDEMRAFRISLLFRHYKRKL